jgi:hypothetical protein
LDGVEDERSSEMIGKGFKPDAFFRPASPVRPVCRPFLVSLMLPLFYFL